ncbi:hypothetical protein AcV5_005813 [Taiwanofungus camphoratus]|nr:hypothetical protein AcV5_005813 [Antrodia cinnamomea]
MIRLYEPTWRLAGLMEFSRSSTHLHLGTGRAIGSRPLHLILSLDVQKDTSTIVFNMSELCLEDAILNSDASQNEQMPLSRNFGSVMERCSLTLPFLSGSKAQLKLTFFGELTDSMMRYYRSMSGDEGNSKVYSLFELQVFPCWDEPLLKATFRITLISHAGTVNLSIMPVAPELEFEHGSGQDESAVISWLSDRMSLVNPNDANVADKWKVTRFETGPLMSTYLVAFANGHFTHLESSYTSPLSGKTRPLRI